MGLPPWCLLIVAVGLGFAHVGGDRGLLHLVLFVLLVDWCYCISTFFFFFFLLLFLVVTIDYGLLVVASGVCSAAVVGLW